MVGYIKSSERFTTIEYITRPSFAQFILFLSVKIYLDIVPNHFNCRVFDRDGNGFITRDELQTAMEMMQETVTEHQVNEMLLLADLDKDGKINYEGMVKRKFDKNIFCICIGCVKLRVKLR